MVIVKSEEHFPPKPICCTDGIKPNRHSQAVIDKQLGWPKVLPPLYNNKWVHFKLERTLPLHTVRIIWGLIPHCSASLSARQRSGTGADMMEVLVFMGKDNDVRAAASSPDIRLRPCLLSVRCKWLEYTWGWFNSSGKRYVSACTHTPTHTECRVKIQSSESPGRSLT